MRIPDEEAAPGEEQNKYINASWILFKDFKQKFIASQVQTKVFRSIREEISVNMVVGGGVKSFSCQPQLLN